MHPNRRRAIIGKRVKISSLCLSVITLLTYHAHVVPNSSLIFSFSTFSFSFLFPFLSSSTYLFVWTFCFLCWTLPHFPLLYILCFRVSLLGDRHWGDTYHIWLAGVFPMFIQGFCSVEKRANTDRVWACDYKNSTNLFLIEVRHRCRRRHHRSGFPFRHLVLYLTANYGQTKSVLSYLRTPHQQSRETFIYRSMALKGWLHIHKGEESFPPWCLGWMSPNSNRLRR